MNLRNLQLLLEAVAVTVCLIWIAGQQAEAKTLTSKVAINIAISSQLKSGQLWVKSPLAKECSSPINVLTFVATAIHCIEVSMTVRR